MRTLTSFSLLCCVSTTLLAQNRLRVPSQFPTLAAAVAAANDGDTIEIASGVHATNGTTITRSLDIVGVGATLNGVLTLAIPAGKALTMSGCRLGEVVSWPTPIATIDLRIAACTGRVTIGDAPPGYGTVTITASTQVLLHDFGIDDDVNYAFGAPLTAVDARS